MCHHMHFGEMQADSNATARLEQFPEVGDNDVDITYPEESCAFS